MGEASTVPPKKDVARALLLRGNLFVWLDPRREIPAEYARYRDLAELIGGVAVFAWGKSVAHR